MRLQGFGSLVEHGGILRTDVRLVEVKVHATQNDLFRRRRRWWRRWWRRWRRRWWWSRRWRRGRCDQVADNATDDCTTDDADRKRLPLVTVIGCVYAASDST